LLSWASRIVQCRNARIRPQTAAEEGEINLFLRP
jgi:hypothetical protein